MKANHHYRNLRVFRLVWVFYCLFIIYGILIPFRLGAGSEVIFSKLAEISWIPFVDPDGTRASIPDIVQNILLFVPFGFLAFLALSYAHTARIALVTCIGALFSMGIETMQLLTIDRTTSVTDLITNTTGAFFGAFAASVTLLIGSEVMASPVFRKYRKNPFVFPLLVFGALTIFGSLQPFDFTLDVGSVWSKVKLLRHAPFDFSPILRDEGVVFVRFGLLAYMWSRFFQIDDHKYHFLKGLVISTVVGVFLEGGQFFVASRMPAIQDLVVVLAGSLCGGGLAAIRHIRKIPRILWGMLIMSITLISVSIQLFNPFQIAHERRLMNWVPFLPYYERTTFIALSNSIESMLMYFPMGFLLQYLFSRRTPRFLLLGGLTLAIAFPLEVAQGWIMYRYPDITDVLGALAGALTGVWCCSEGRAAFECYLRRT